MVNKLINGLYFLYLESVKAHVTPPNEEIEQLYREYVKENEQ